MFVLLTLAVALCHKIVLCNIEAIRMYYMLVTGNVGCVGDG